MIDLRHGDYADVLAAETWDACIFDAPYGARTHNGHNAVDVTTGGGDGRERSPISYTAWSSIHVQKCVNFIAPRTRRWICTITSHDLAPVWEAALQHHGRYVFAPIPIVVPGMTVRMQGDGPSSWTCWMVVARPKTKDGAAWRALPGAYIRQPGDPRSPITGGKPLNVMRAIVRDYSDPGDVICDPTAGGGTTLLAAAMEHRQAIGAEVDKDTWALAVERLSRPYQPSLV